MKNTQISFAGAALLLLASGGGVVCNHLNAATPSDSWAITDALGRTARSYDKAGDKDSTRYVGMFYWTWHQGPNDTGAQDTRREVKNISQVLREHPEAINDYNHPAWGGKKRPNNYYWDEPIFGYYKTTDPWVLRKHAEMLADAGVDAVFFDCTNGSLTWDASTKALLETWSQAQKDGVNVPKIVYMLPFAPTPDSKVSLHHLYDWLYSKGDYQNLWFYWKGKPLIMAYPDNLTEEGKDQEIRDFFTFRPGQPDYVNGPEPGSKQWGWLEIYPTHGYAKDEKTGKYEQCTVGVGQNAGYQTGGHCCAFNLPGTFGRKHSTNWGPDFRPDGHYYGRNIQEQWDRAINVLKPELVFVTGWNEWTSGMWKKVHGWSDPLSFVDQFDADHSRDIEPTKGWGEKGDVFYQQLVDNVRRFKGMDKPQEVSSMKSIKLGKAGEWDGVLPKYTAYKGNVFHRDHLGAYNMYYTDNSGRNDITGAQVAHDKKNVYFRVETADAMTPSSDPNWMMLFIDIDRDKTTGWNGYDYIVNRVSPDAKKVKLERASGNEWEWQEAGEAVYSLNGNVLEIAVPKKLLGVGEDVDFEFKWNDNMQHPGDVLDFYVSGDTAPGGRFNYVYTSVNETK